MSRSTHILFGVILIAAIQTASAEPQTNVAATSAGPERAKLASLLLRSWQCNSQDEGHSTPRRSFPSLSLR